jgi:hypothetical protein
VGFDRPARGRSEERTACTCRTVGASGSAATSVLCIIVSLCKVSYKLRGAQRCRAILPILSKQAFFSRWVCSEGSVRTGVYV